MSYKRKLIETGLPLAEMNPNFARERSRRVGHPSTLHLWWARRPVMSAVVVLFASMVDDPAEHPDRFPTAADQSAERMRLHQLMVELSNYDNWGDTDLQERAHTEILRSCDGVAPPVLDPFCGGGTIPLAAQWLGLPAYGGDMNPVAVLITKAMVEIPARFTDRPPVNPQSHAETLAYETLAAEQGHQDTLL